MCNAGGGFACGRDAGQLPARAGLSKKGYNAFALIYRPAQRRAGMARAINFIFEHADKLEVDTSIIPFGAARRADAWRRGSARMERRSSASRIIRALPPSFAIHGAQRIQRA
ncbi:MAG: hypothetical protein ACLUI3_12225 [Christensenellales bacterium]